MYFLSRTTSSKLGYRIGHSRPSVISYMLLGVVLIVLVAKVVGASEEDHKYGPPLRIGGKIRHFKNEELDDEEFMEFCELGQFERQGRTIHEAIVLAECDVTAPGEFDKEIDCKMLFTLILIMLWGVIVRAFLHLFDIHFPYTVILLLSGLIVGAFSQHFCDAMHEYTALARVSSSVILYTFLPLLIFESAFSINVHTFQRATLQILLVAFPGMLICTFITAAVCIQYFTSYQWDLMKAALFGAIISATDPVAVVAILRELGVSEVLSVMIEGESLMNDGVAILLYEIFEDIVQEKYLIESGVAGAHKTTQAHLVVGALKKFAQIAIGGPAFGWLMGKIVIFLLGYVFNDPPVEISATIVIAYLTYWISENQIHVSGVMAVVLLGLTMRAERTVISPDSMEPVHHFWSIVGYLANTVLFVLVGIVIAETSLQAFELDDMWNLLLLYIGIHVSRFFMLTILYPLLACIGYGITWQNMIVMMWGGLRGAVGVCLALDVFRNPHFCQDKTMGGKMLFHTAGIVFLTLVVNGTTTRPLLAALHLTDISAGRKEDMNNAVKRMQRLKAQGIRMFILTPRMFDADWVLVNGYCTISNPYKETSKPTKEKVEEKDLTAPEPVVDNATICGTCHTLVPNEPTSEEYFNLTEEARLKVIRAMKVSYTHRNGVGLLSDTALHILMNDAERCEDIKLQLICSRDFDKHTKSRGVYLWLSDKLTHIEGVGKTLPACPPQRWRRIFWRLVTYEWYITLVMVLILLNMIPIIWELSIGCNPATEPYFNYCNIAFNVLFTLEWTLSFLGHTTRHFFTDPWTYLDFIVLIFAYVDMILSIIYPCEPLGKYWRITIAVRFLRISRALRLLRPLLPKVQYRIKSRINEQLFVGLDVLRGFTYASEEVVKFLPQMIENKRVLKEIKDHIEAERTEGLKVIAGLQQKHPGTAIALKTRYACRTVINTMAETLHEAKDEGLLDDTEAELLDHILELKVKRLWHFPVSLEAFASNVLLQNLSWLEYDEDLYDSILETAELQSFTFGQTLAQFGEEASGIYVIVAGMIKITYHPTPQIIDDRNQYGKIPNTELLVDYTFAQQEVDYFTTGFVFGEVGVVSGQPWAADITAETSLVVYHLPSAIIKSHIKKFNNPLDPLEGQIWKAIGIRRATAIVEHAPEFIGRLDRIETILQKSTVPVDDDLNLLEFPSYVSDVILIEGIATDPWTKENYVAPFIIPTTCKKIFLPHNPKTVNRILIIAREDNELTLSTDEKDRRHSHSESQTNEQDPAKAV